MTDPTVPTDPVLYAAGDRAAVRVERFLHHPVERVWEAVTRPEHLQAWFPTEVTIELEPGGVVRYQWDAGEADGADPRFGEVLEIDPPHLLAFTWGADHLRFQLAAEAGGTRFVLEHAFDDRAGAASFAAGWEACLGALAPVLAHEPVPAPDRMVDRHEELAARFGLDRPTVTEDGGRWTIRWERQLTAPAEVAWDLFFGIDPGTGEQRAAPAVGEPLTPHAAPEVVLGTVTELDAPRALAFEVADGEPGDLVRFELAEGTGHGARLLLTVSGSTDRPGERDAAEEQWGRGAVADLAAGAADWARAHA